MKAAGLSDALTALTVRTLAPINHHVLLGYSDEVLWNTLIAVFVALHLVGVRSLARRPEPLNGRLARTIRWCAGASFSLYVVHYPTLHLLDATLPDTLPGHDLWLLGLTLTICLAFAALFERPLASLRRGVRTLWTMLREPRRETRTQP